MITKEEIKKTKFKEYNFEANTTSKRTTREEAFSFNNDDVLRDMISKKTKEYAQKYGCSNKYEEISRMCQMSPKTLKSAINGTTSRITREFLYKFTVGLKMSIDEANSLFELCGGELHLDCLEDKICHNALRDGDSALSFIDEYNMFSAKPNLKKLEEA